MRLIPDMVVLLLRESCHRLTFSAAEAPCVDKGVVRFHSVLQMFGFVVGAIEVFRTSHIRKLQRRQRIGRGGGNR